MAAVLKINQADNVAVAVSDVAAGDVCLVDGRRIVALAGIPAGHKMALRDIGKGENIRGLTDFYGIVPGMACAYQVKEVKDVILPSQQEFGIQETANDDMPHFIRPASLANRRPLMSDILRK